jgi:hypothetical protein
MTEHQWGDPTASFPYCLTYEEYEAITTEVANRGLSPEQLAGSACVRCGAAVCTDVHNAEVGQLAGQWRNTETGETIEAVRVLVACETCRPGIACPWWCEGGHLPFIRGQRHFDFAVHSQAVARLADVLGTGDRAVDLVIQQHEDEDGVRAAYIWPSGTDLELDAAKARMFAAAFLNAADKLDEITGVAR